MNMRAVCGVGVVAGLMLVVTGCARITPHRVCDASVPADRIVSLMVPVNIEVLAIDGQGVRHDIAPMCDQFQFELAPGAHRVQVCYSGLSSAPSTEQQDMVSSAQLELSFEGVPGKTYVLKYKQPSIDVRDSDGAVMLTAWIEPAGSNVRTVSHERAAKPPAKAPPPVAPVPVPACAVSTSKAVARDVAPVAAPVPVSAASATLDQLKHSWQQAGEQERGEFLKWIVAPK